MRSRWALSLWALLALAAAAAPARAATAEEAEIASRMTQDASEFLDRLVGRGKAKVLVTVEGESSEIQTQTEMVTPIRQPEAAGPSGVLPGYGKTEKGGSQGPESVQKDLEKTSRRASFAIKKLHVAVVLDQSVPEELSNTARRLLLTLLRVDTQRGDDLVILRTRLQTSSWETLWSTPEGVRVLLIAALACGLILLTLISAHAIAGRLTRVVGAVLAERRGGPLPAGPGAPGLEARAVGGAFPDLLAGGMPSLEEGSAEGGREGVVPALGHRFDFLTSMSPVEMAAVAAKEPPEDLALLFASLAESQPDLASRLFSLLPGVLQGEISQTLVKMDMADPEKLAMLETRMRTSVEFAVRGPDRLSRILSRLPPTERENLLGDLMDREPAAAEELRRSMFPFESIAELKREELRRLIIAVPYEVWGVALRASSDELVEKVLSELPAGTRGAIRDAMGVQQPKEKVMEARSKVVSQAFALAAKGQIALGGAGRSAELI